MTKYTLPMIAKAVVGGVVAAVGTATAAATTPHGVDLSVLSGGEWLLVLGAGLTGAGGVFVTPNKDHKEQASPLEQVLTNVPVVIGNAVNAHTELQQMQDGLNDALSKIPVIGPQLGALGKQVSDLIK